MALIQRKISEKKQITLYGALLGVVLTTFLVAYYGFLRQPAATNTVAPAEGAAEKEAAQQAVPGRSGLDELKKFKDTPAFQKLRRFGQWPLPIEPQGRVDPFLSAPQETEEEE